MTSRTEGDVSPKAQRAVNRRLERAGGHLARPCTRMCADALQKRKGCFLGGTSGGTSILLVVLCHALLCSRRTMLNPAYSLASSHLCRRVRDGAPIPKTAEFAS